MCARAVRIGYSRKQADRALYALPVREQHLLTVQSMLAAMQALVRTAGCRVSGYLTVEMDVFVAVHAMDDGSSDLLAVTCAREAEKLATLVEAQSAPIVTDVALSALIGARLVETGDEDGGWDGRSSGRRPCGLGGWWLVVLCMAAAAMRWR